MERSSLYHFITLSLYHFITLSLYHFITLSLYHFITLKGKDHKETVGFLTF